MEQGKSIEKSLITGDYSYNWIHVFFWVSEFFLSFAFFGMKESLNLFRSEYSSAIKLVDELQPVSMILVGYVTDSFIGKYYMFHATSCFILLGSIVLTIIYGIDKFIPELGICLMVFVVLGEGWHPLRHAIVYSQLTPPVNKIRRFVLIQMAASTLGEGLTFLLELTPLKRREQVLWLATQMIITTAVFYLGIFVLHRYKLLRFDFQIFATEKSLRSIHRASHHTSKTETTDSTKNKPKKPRPKMSEDQIKRAMGLLFVLIVLAFCSMVFFDSFIITYYLSDYKFFVTASNVPKEFPMYFMFYLAAVVLMLTIEFLLVPLFARWRIHILYTSMISVSFVVALAALMTLGILAVKIGFAAPFPPPFEGEAHITLFNCLPVQSELEWPDGLIDVIPRHFYHRVLNIPVVGGRTMELRNMAIFNPAFGLYQLANLSIEADKENIFIIKSNGTFRVNSGSRMLLKRRAENYGQIRILNCLEECCHGQVIFEFRGSGYLTYDLSESNYLSEKLDMPKGTYSVFYSPDKKQKLNLGEIEVTRANKFILMIHSLENVGLKIIHMVSVEFNRNSFYFPLLTFKTLILVTLEPFLKLLIILKTDRTIYTIMFGVLFSLELFVEFACFLVYPAFSSFYLFYVSLIVLTGLFLFFFLFTVIKMHRYANPEMPLTLRSDRSDRKSLTSNRSDKKMPGGATGVPRASEVSGYSQASEALSTTSDKFKTI